MEGIDLENYFCEGQMEIEDYMEEHKKMENQIIMLALSKIKHHPKNPRKNIGDVTELAESIKKNGIMQNLTVMHDPDDPEGYICLIGHRRMTAAAQAGLEEVPCRVVQIDEKEQIAMMLQENIQRNDLTIPEQAYGFQYMFDLGASADEIAEKTGLNRSTVYHRLNIAKLDKETLEAKANDEDFQLSFKDLLELEKIEDIGKRNELLKECSTKSDLTRRVELAVREQKIEKNTQAIKNQLVEAGIEDAPKEFKDNRWSNDWIILLAKYIDEETTDIQIPEIEGKTLFYDFYNGYLKVVVKPDIIGKAEKKPKSKWEIEREKKDACCKKLSEFWKGMLAELKKNVHLIIDGKIFSNDYADSVDIFWNVLTGMGADISSTEGASFFLKGKTWYQATREEHEACAADWNDLEILSQMVILAYQNIKGKDTWTWDGKYEMKRYTPSIKSLYEALKDTFGITLKKEEEDFLNGTSDMYYREDEEEEDDEDDYWSDEEDEEDDDE